MPYPPATHWGNDDTSEISVRPTADVLPGVLFLDPQTNRYVIAQRDLVANEHADARDNGKFRCRKQNPLDMFDPGAKLTFGVSGYISGADPLVVCEPSAAGEEYVIAELNPPSEGSGSSSDTRRELRVTEFDLLADIPGPSVTINLNASTPGYTSLRAADNPYATHAFSLNLATFAQQYGKDYWIEWSGQKLPQSKVVVVTADAVQIHCALARAGGELRVISYINVAV